MHYVRFFSPELKITARPKLTAASVLVQHQGEGWSNVQRHWNISFTNWDGAPAYELQVPCIFDQFKYNPDNKLTKNSIEDSCRVMERLCEYIPRKRRTAIVRIDSGGSIPHDYTNDPQKWWVITSIAWGDYIINNQGNRCRQEFTVNFWDWRPETILKNKVRLPDQPVPKTYRVKRGDTLPKIAAYFYGDQAEWRNIASLNKVPHPLQLKVGNVLKMPKV